MQPESKPTLDYSSRTEEQRREQAGELKRRKEIELYNESTFGESRPVAAAFIRIMAFVAIAAVLVWILPRRTGGLVVSGLAIAFVVLGWRKEGWGSAIALRDLRYPWRRWR